MANKVRQARINNVRLKAPEDGGRVYRRTPNSSLLGERLKYDPYGEYFRYQDGTTDNPSELVRRKGLSLYHKMGMDEQVKAALHLKRISILNHDWEVLNPDGSPDLKETNEHVHFVKDALREIDGSFYKVAYNMLSALQYGFSVTEKVYEENLNPEWPGKVFLRTLRTRDPASLRFKQDTFGNVQSVIQEVHRGTEAGEIVVPMEKVAIYSYMGQFGNPYGTSDLEAAFRPWWAKDTAYKYLSMLLERYGIPPLFALFNAHRYTDSQVGELQDILENIQAATSGTIPRAGKDDLELWQPEVGLSRQSAQLFIDSIRKYDEDLARALLLPTMMGLTPDSNVGSMARSTVHFDVFMVVVDGIRKEFEEVVINEQIIKPLVALNYDLKPDEYPVFRFAPATAQAKAEMLKAWEELVGAGVVKRTKQDERHVRRLLGFPLKYEEADVITDPPPGSPAAMPGASPFAPKGKGESKPAAESK